MKQNPIASIVLAAGRGTRMKDNAHNKVCFDCAGVPVIRRVVQNMKDAGVQNIVVVVGHMAQDVMDALYGIPGILFVYQKVQNGTGSATLLGLIALKEMGFDGSVIVSVGDKIISTGILKDYVNLPAGDAIYGVQKSGINPSGGRIAFRNNKPYGICEFADAAMLRVWPGDRRKWQSSLKKLGMSEKKISSVTKNADIVAQQKGWFVQNRSGSVNICGETFSADELLNSPYTNLALYRFDLNEALEALQSVKPKNVQGEIYVTDTMEYFAAKGKAKLYVVENEKDVLTYSTKPELIAMSRHFMRKAEEMKTGANEREQRTIDAFIDHFGNKPVVITKAPGRVNILGRHVDHRGGNTNVMAIDRDTMLVVSPREDCMVRVANTNPGYPCFEFNIDDIMNAAPHESWISFIESDGITKFVKGYKGAWYNYIISIIARIQFSTESPLCGMDILMDGTIPVAAGLSSSSSIVVATAEAITALNCISVSTAQFIDWCGEGEWFVGTRGGAGDHAAMKCSEKGRITRLGFKPFVVGSSEAFSDKYAIILANSNIKSNKAEGSKDKFNAKVAAYEIGFMLMKKYFPEYNMVELRDAASIRPYSNIYRMLKRLPETATRQEILELMPESRERIEHFFSSHADPGTYDIRGVILFGISECARSKVCLDYLANEDYVGLGNLMKISHNGDRVTSGYPMKISDDYLIYCSEHESDIALQPGAYGCSIPEIDWLCDMLNETDGVLGSQMLGAGLGGFIAALVEKDKVDSVIQRINREYYDRYRFPHLAQVYMPEKGSSIAY